MSTASETAQKLLDFYGGDETRWTQGQYAKNRTHGYTSPLSEEATSWCLVGARDAMGIDSSASTALAEQLPPLPGTPLSRIVFFNDHNDFPTVMAKLKEIAEAG